MKLKFISKTVYLLAILALIFSAVSPEPTQAAGIYTHNWYVEKAIQRLAVRGGYSDLIAILNRYPATVNFGAAAPDLTVAAVDPTWSEILHDTNVTRGNYLQYVQNFLPDHAGYSKTDTAVQMGYYREFLNDPAYTAAIPPYRAALMRSLAQLVKKTSRTVDEEKKIAFLFGVIAHQEADVPWHLDWNGAYASNSCTNPNLLDIGWGVECEATRVIGFIEFLAEPQIDGLLYYYGGEDPEHRIEFDYLPAIRSTLLAAADYLGPRPQPVCALGVCVDALDAGLGTLRAAWALKTGLITQNDAIKNWLVAYVPGGINYSSGIVAAAWMQAWDTMKNDTGILYAATGGTGDCHNWAQACDLAFALNHAYGGQEIWARGGVYYPNASINDSNASFTFQPGVAVYGGFVGSETARSQRDILNNTTILSGDVDHNDNQQPVIMDIKTVTGNSTNSYHVVRVINGATLDGLVITGGYADGGYPDNIRDNLGAGMYNGIGTYYAAEKILLNNVALSGNYARVHGGAIFNQNVNVTISNATFSNNQAADSCGALYNYGSGPSLVNVTFYANTAVNGGAMCNSASNPTLTNVTIYNNTATGSGGGIYNNVGSSPLIRNTILWGNDAPSGAQIFNSSSTPVVTDSVVQGGYPYSGGTRIYVGDPLLGSFGSHDGFTSTIPILRGSSAYNKGNAAYCTVQADQRGKPYVGICDIGAYEYSGAAPRILYVKPDEKKPAGSCLFGWNDACDMRTALASQENGAEIWVMQGVYRPNYPGTDLSRSDTFQLRESETFYGGFPDTANPTFADRDPVKYPTILSGDIDQNDDQAPIITDLAAETNNNKNSYHVVTGAHGATLDGFIVTGGYAEGNSSCDVDTTACGAGMLNDHISVTVSNTEFIGNYARVGGGGVLNYSNANGDNSSIFVNVKFTGNKADYGGGVRNLNYPLSANKKNNSTFTNVTYTHNQAGVNGGGSEDYGFTGSYSNATFSENSAGQFGGALNITASSSPTITDATFYNNTADSGAGAIHNGSNGTYTNVTFEANEATVNGGGLVSWSGSSPTLVNATFYANKAGQNGGAIANITNAGVTLKNVTISGNDARLGSGGAIYNLDGVSQLTQLWNTILWGNYAGTAYKEVYIQNSQNFHVNTSVVVQGGCPTGAVCLPNPPITADPMLKSFGDNGGLTKTYSIRAGSSAINKGVDCTRETDQRGVARVGACDIGAYEYDYTGTYYVQVPPIAAGAECQSWNDACALQTALTSVTSGDEVWVKAGVHYPTTTISNDRTASFKLASGVGVYGGFAGTETTRDQRDPVTKQTVLSGDIDQNDKDSGNNRLLVITDLNGVTGNSTNSYHVVMGADGATLDGFTITAGFANSNNYYDYGGGMFNWYTSPTVRNVTFSGNKALYGGGLANIGSTAAQVINSTFVGNNADTYGGGLINYQSTSAVTNVTFVNNKAGYGGAVLEFHQSHSVFKHVTLYGNTATGNSGGLGTSDSSTVEVYNSILWGNTAPTGPQIFVDYANAGSATVSDCVIQNGYPYAGGANISDVNPYLEPTLSSNGGFTQTLALKNNASSSALDTGSDTFCVEVDQRSVARPQGEKCDIGAFELEAYTLTIDSANGVVTKSPNVLYHHNGDIIQLTVTPNHGWKFTGWSGDLTGSANPASITIQGNKAVTANFDATLYLPAIRR